MRERGKWEMEKSSWVSYLATVCIEILFFHRDQTPMLAETKSKFF
jgi:hypothetical protein